MNGQLFDFDMYRQASESWFKVPGAGASPGWARDAQKKWMDLATEILNRHRESVDGLYRSAIHLFQQTPAPPQTSPSPGETSSEDHLRSAHANGTQALKTTRKPGSKTSRRSRKTAGKRPGAK